MEKKENIEELKEEETSEKKQETPNKKVEKQKKKEKDNKLQEEFKKLEEENKNLIEKVKLAQAELINYRRRKDEETNSMMKYANQDLIMELLPIVDNFERAIKLDDNDLTDELSKFLDGFKMMYASLKELLKKFGVEEINRVGEIFDPKQEQALLTDCVEELEDEVVIEVLLKGYKLKDRVIRPASVKINQK
ncbi:MAG: nucleotide exchange factor GrpE [Bacilli bacterium]|nr:nucleotide exchange factor GrpE [Bacilli bacterium]